MEQLFDLLDIQLPLWGVLLIALFELVSILLVVGWLSRIVRKSASKGNNWLTKAIRSWLGTPKTITMSEAELDESGGIDNVEGDDRDQLIIP